MLTRWKMIFCLAPLALSQVGFAVVGGALDYVKISVNGDSRIVRKGKELKVVLGDRIVIESAPLVGSAKKAANVNLVGFVSALAKRRAEDRGFEVDTANSMSKRWSIGKKGEVYKITVDSGKHNHGEVFIRLLKPELVYADLMVNGVSKRVRLGDQLILNGSDKIKLNKVVTNIENDGQEVSLKMVPLGEGPETLNLAFYELQFIRSGFAFAKIVLQIKKKENGAGKQTTL